MDCVLCFIAHDDMDDSQAKETAAEETRYCMETTG